MSRVIQFPRGDVRPAVQRSPRKHRAARRPLRAVPDGEQVDLPLWMIPAHGSGVVINLAGPIKDTDIIEGDALVVDKKLTPMRGDITVVRRDGATFAEVYGGGLRLATEEPKPAGELIGVATFVIRRLREAGREARGER
jgi:hypothetical protein